MKRKMKRRAGILQKYRLFSRCGAAIFMCVAMSICLFPLRSYASTLVPGGYKPTAELTDKDRLDEHQKNFQEAYGANEGCHLYKTAEWTNKQTGDAKIVLSANMNDPKGTDGAPYKCSLRIQDTVSDVFQVNKVTSEGPKAVLKVEGNTVSARVADYDGKKPLTVTIEAKLKNQGEGVKGRWIDTNKNLVNVWFDEGQGEKEGCSVGSPKLFIDESPKVVPPKPDPSESFTCVCVPSDPSKTTVPPNGVTVPPCVTVCVPSDPSKTTVPPININILVNPPVNPPTVTPPPVNPPTVTPPPVNPPTVTPPPVNPPTVTPPPVNPPTVTPPPVNPPIVTPPPVVVSPEPGLPAWGCVPCMPMWDPCMPMWDPCMPVVCC